MRATRTEHTDVGCSEHLKLLSDELKFSECIRIAVRTFRQNACEGQCLLRAVRLDRDIVFLFDGRSRRLNDQFTPSPSPPKPYTVSTPNKACPEPPMQTFKHKSALPHHRKTTPNASDTGAYVAFSKSAGRNPSSLTARPARSLHAEKQPFRAKRHRNSKISNGSLLPVSPL